MASDKDFEKANVMLMSPRIEGGFSNHPLDPGMATNHGISLRFLKDQQDYDLGDLDKDGDIDIDDIKLMETDKARPIFKKYFWDYFPMKKIPAPVAYVLFNVAVNSGQVPAAKLLQHALNVKQDGLIGPKTLAALNKLDAFEVAETMCTLRYAQYYSYVKAAPKKKTFLNGWLARVDFMREDYKKFNYELVAEESNKEPDKENV